MLADTSGAEYTAFVSLEKARRDPKAIAILEGDWGGRIYLTVPVAAIRCDESVLRDLLVDLDRLQFDDPEGAGLFFERHEVGSAIAGGGDGGLVTGDLWLHKELEAIGIRTSVEAVLAGTRTRLAPVGRT